MERVKCFSVLSETEAAERLEGKINTWLEQNPGAGIVRVLQSSNAHHQFLTIFYLEEAAR